MARNHNDQEAVRQYLLGRLPKDEHPTFEERLLSEDELFEQLLIAEDELVDELAAGLLSSEDSEHLKKYFLSTREGKTKQQFAEVWRRNQKKFPPEPEPGILSQLRAWFANLRLETSPLAVAAMAFIVVGAGFVVWRAFVYQSDVDKGLIALNNAYSQERPTEARITQLNYAPFSTRRGSPANFNASERDRAGRILLDAVHEDPIPASYHALAKFYLANKEFDRAIEQLENALKSDNKNAQIHADLGAAWLEKAKLDLNSAATEPSSPEAGKAVADLGRSLENLNKALELDPNCLEALFNRALCREYLKLPLQAEEDWRRYLEKDSASPWADEARRRLQLLDQQRSNTSQTKESLLRDFISAYQSQNREAAWSALSLSRARVGNLIVESLLDEFLDLERQGRAHEANEKLLMVSYAGELELEKVGDRFDADVANFYRTASAGRRELVAQARTELALAGAHSGKGEFEKAIDGYAKAKVLLKQTGNTPALLMTDSLMGYSSLRIPKVKESIEIFEPLAKEFERRKYRSLLAQSLHALSDAASSRNEFSKALSYAKRGLQIAQEIGDNATAVRCLGQCVSMQLILGNYQESLRSFDTAVKFAAKIPPDPRLTWPLYHEAALNFYLLGWSAPALSFEEEALRLANSAGVPLLRSRSWERLGLIYGSQKNFERAKESVEKALAEAQNVSGAGSQKNIVARSNLILGELHCDAGEHRKAIEYFDRALTNYNDLDFDAYSYQAHKGKLRALMALGENGFAEAELGTVLTLFEDQRKKILEAGNRDRFFDNGQDTYDLAIDFAYSRRKDSRQAFAYAEASRARSLFEMITNGESVINDHENLDLNLGAGSTPLTLEEIQAAVPENVQLVEYAVLDDKMLIWVISRSAVNSEEVTISARDLEQKTRSYAAALSRPSQRDRDAVVEAAKELHAKLIAPVEKYLSQERVLCVIPDKSLNYLPFEALVAESSGRYLIQDYSVQRAPSATIFIDSTRRAKTREQVPDEKILSVGNPKFAAAVFRDLSDLPGAAREARKIAAFYRPAVSLVADEATAARVKRGLLEADVIHLATHAVANERTPLLSTLLLTPNGAGESSETDGALRAFEVYQLRQPRARLVVLSACQTGIERAYRGEGAVGFARPFIAAGVPLVVASLWPVDSDATADLMISFHGFRKQQHLPTVEALRQAQLQMIAQEQSGATGTTYGWAAFSVIGGYATF